MGSVYTLIAGKPVKNFRDQAAQDPPSLEHLTVLMDGAKAVGTRPGPAIQELLLQEGDFLKVLYPSTGRFDGAAAAKKIACFAAKYKVVTLFGLSMGGHLAYDTLCLLKTRQTQCRLLLADAPFTGGDIKEGGARKLARYTPSWAVLPDSINRRLIGSPPKQQDSKLLADHHEYVARLRIGVLASRLRFLFSHPEPSAHLLQDVPLLYIRSLEDPVVRKQAAKKWVQASGRSALCSVESQGHIKMLDHPDQWMSAILLAFDWLKSQE